MVTETKVRQIATLKTQELVRAVEKVNLIKPTRQPPSLVNVLAQFSPGKVKLTTSDLERIIQVTLDCDCVTEFSALLPRRRLATFLKGDDGNISIEVKGQSAIIEREGIGQFKIDHTTLVEDFPPILQYEVSTWQSIDAEYLRRMLPIALMAISKWGRPVLAGGCCQDGCMASADGFRLVVIQNERLTFGTQKQVIIPGETLAIVKKLFAKDAAIEIGIPSDRTIIFKAGSVEMVSQLIQGTYPNYQQLIPPSFLCKVSFSAPLMAQRLNMMDDNALNGGIARYEFAMTEKGEHECHISGGNEVEGQYSVRMPVKLDTGAGKIAFSKKYIQDVIKFFSVCSLAFTSTASPGKFTGDLEGVTIVVMPMFVQW